ncbi:MAG: tRNA (adenosine(37)-N6)-threonylcarbamoyltransferase complex transferase subunit TsaD [Candidatus Buchananbacteria bacterium]
MIILAIETSCDETSTAILRATKGKLELLSNIVSSQIDIHKQYGGVVPEVAARHHVLNINPVINESLDVARIKAKDIDLIATVSGPGLITSLIVGVEAAKTLSMAWKKPLMQINHMYSHIAGNFLNKIEFPVMCLVVSGGHTELVYLKNYWQFKKIGQTVDDAAGEAFDKVAKLLGLGYPGGPIVSAEADKFKAKELSIKFPRPMIDSDNFNFSFSGLKTSVLYATQKMTAEEKKKKIPEICFGFQQAVIDVLVSKTIKASKQFKVKTVLMAGGVAANKSLRESLKNASENNGYEFFVPEFKLCTDNAAMVALAAYYLSQNKKPKLDNWKKVKVDPNWELK